jgi:hypothetical protein
VPQERKPAARSVFSFLNSPLVIDAKVVSLQIPAWVIVSILFLIVVLVYLDPIKGVSATKGIASIFMGSVDAEDPDASTTFAHTALFFAPDANDGRQDKKRNELEDWLVKRFGGFSSWSVSGKYTDGKDEYSETGRFYQASLPKDSHDLDHLEVESKLTALYGPGKYYILHFRAGSPAP